MIQTRKIILGLALAALGTAQALAAVSEEEAAQLGKTLTPWGAEIAGNKEGTIPAYTGGLTKTSASYNKSTGMWADPYADEKPLFRIDAKNMAQYADKLSEGTKELLKRYPDTYYLNVYPSHRPLWIPEWLQKNTIRNATKCTTIDGGLGVDVACRGGIPFPIPKTGYEAMWNSILPYDGVGHMTNRVNSQYTVDASGTPVLTLKYKAWTERPFYQVSIKEANPDLGVHFSSVNLDPPRRAGEATMIEDFLDPNKHARRALSYTPGQRRIKLAPEFSYDTPGTGSGGMMFFDEVNLFFGKMDRFDFKLKGKKEMYIPYNAYKAVQGCAVPKELFAKHHINPECERWELHRTLYVEGTLKPGMRHAQSKKVFYWDEDAKAVGLYDTWDQGGNLFRGGHSYGFFVYDKGFFFAPTFVLYDFNKRGYNISNTDVHGHDYSDAPVPPKEANFESFVGTIAQ